MKSKRTSTLRTKVERTKQYSLEEAVPLLKELATAKFNETIEMHFNMGIDPKKGDQQIRGTVVLPHGTGKTIRVAAFVDAANEAAAKEAGADIIATEETINEIVKTGKIDFDVAVTIPAMMPKLAKAARVLGPRGLMPNLKTDTVGPNIEKMVKEQKGGKVSFKNDDTSNVHTVIGKASFTEEQIKDNAKAFVDALRKVKPASAKGIYIKSAVITSTMAPAIKLDVGTI